MHLKLKLLAIGLGCSVLLYGQNSQSALNENLKLVNLKEVVVSDLKAPLGFAYKGATETILTEEDLMPFRSRGVAAALNSLAGIEVNGSRGAQGTVMSIYARGGRGKQALILIDGIRVADPASASLSFDLRLLDLSQIQSIKVIKGANSSLYGSSAATVVIDITTKKHAEKPISWQLNAIVGTHQGAEDRNNKLAYSNYNTRLSGSQKQWDYSLSYSRQDAKGLSSFKTANREEDPYQQDAFRMVVGRKLSESIQAQIFVDKQSMKAAYDDAFMGLDANNTFETIKKSMGTQWVWQQNRGVLKANLSLASYDSKDVSAYGSEVLAKNLHSDLIYRFFISEKWNLISGFQVIKDQIEENEMQGTEASEYLITDPYISLGYIGTAIQLQIGGRYNYHSQYNGQWVYHINPSIFLDAQKNFRAHAAVSTAYITPTLGMFFGPYGANKDLKPETNTNAEVGLAFDNQKGTQLGITYFQRNENQAIIFNGPAFLYENNPEQTWARGFETQFFTTLLKDLKMSANYSWVALSETAIRIPKHKANLSLNYSPKPTQQLSAIYAFTGSRKDTNFSTYEQISLEAFSVVDLQYSFPLGLKNANAFLSANNVFNSDFVETVGYQTLGRNVRFGVQFQL